MKASRIVLMIVAIPVALVIVLAGAGAYFVHRYVQSPAFKEQVLATACEKLGTDVRIDSFHVSLFSGVTLRGVTIGNPKDFPGNLLTADAFVLRYRFLPLLHRRVEIEQLTLNGPVITLARNDKSEWNYEKMGAKAGEAKPSAAVSEPTPVTPNVSRATTSPFEIVLSQLALTHGTVLILSEKNKPLVKIDGINFSSSVSFADNKPRPQSQGRLAGAGKVSLDKVSVADTLFVQKLTAPVAISENQIKCAPLSGRIADGALTGDVTLQLTPGFNYSVNLQVKNGDVAKLLAEAGTKQVMNGKLEVTASLRGTGGLSTIVGNGRAEIMDGRLVKIPVLNLLASLLQIEALRDLKFDKCLLEFSITNNVLQTPVIQLTSPQVAITGKGTMSLDDDSLNHDMTIAFTQGALDRVPKEIRSLFTQRQDGSLALDFRVWGPYDAPQTDLKDRIVKGVTEQLIEKGLQRFLK